MDSDNTGFLRTMATLGAMFSIGFIILQLVPIKALPGVHFVTQSYVLLIVWIVLGAVFYLKQRSFFRTTDQFE